MRLDRTPRTISVVIPTHNRADLLRETLDAIVAQTAPALEVIVVDDCSTDGTCDMLDEYQSRGVSWTRLPRASGPLHARNVGTRMASGDLVAFCDNDDLWDERFLETAQRLWRLVPELRVAYSNFAILRDGARTMRTKFDDAPRGYWDDLRRIAPDLALFDDSPCERMVAFQPFFPSCMVVNRDAFLARGGWDEAVTGLIGCDFATALRMAERTPMGIMTEPLVGIRKHAHNLSGNSEVMSLGNAMVLEHVLRTNPHLQAAEAMVRANVAKRRRNALSAAYVRKDLDAVLRIEEKIPRRLRTVTVRAKAAVARLPRPAGMAVADATLWMGTVASTVRHAVAPRRPEAMTAWGSRPHAERAPHASRASMAPAHAMMGEMAGSGVGD